MVGQVIFVDFLDFSGTKNHISQGLAVVDKIDSRHVEECKAEEMIGCSILTTPLGEPCSCIEN